MILGEAFERFAAESPVSVMARALFENTLPEDELDRLFEANARTQYTRELLFSQVVDLMALVVCNSQPSLSAAIRKRAGTLSVSRKAVYGKINRLEPGVAQALVRFCAARLRGVLDALDPPGESIIPDGRVRIVDGNHLPASEHRLKPLRLTRSGALPGHAVVVFDPSRGLVTDVIACEDGHAQERSLTPALLELVGAADVWVADRNFCTTRLLAGILRRKADVVVRQHAVVRPVPVGEVRCCGRCEAGALSEQDVELVDADEVFRLRRVTLRLDAPTRDGDAEIHILTSLSAERADAARVASVYRSRWRIEAAFGELEAALHSEVRALGYPRAGLFAFCVAVCAFDLLAVLKAAIRSAHGPESPAVSGYHLAHEIGSATRGLWIAVPPSSWVVFAPLTSQAMADWLRETARRVRVAEFRKDKRGPKKPRPPRTSGVRVKHVSTKRLLDQAKT
jgi:IS4 transposase